MNIQPLLQLKDICSIMLHNSSVRSLLASLTLSSAVVSIVALLLASELRPALLLLSIGLAYLARSCPRPAQCCSLRSGSPARPSSAPHARLVRNAAPSAASSCLFYRPPPGPFYFRPRRGHGREPAAAAGQHMRLALHK